LKKILALLLAMGLIFSVGCGGEKNAAKPEASQKIVLGLLPDTDSLPFLVAEEKGYFAEEGIAVELESFKSAMDRDAALQSGNLDGAISDMLAAAFAREGGFNVKITSSTDGNYVLTTAPGEAATSAKELKGKEIAVSKNTIIEYVTDRILARENMAESDVEKVIIPQIPTRLEMLQSDKLAAATLPEPMATVAKAAGCHQVASAEEMKINPGVLLFTEKSLKEKEKEIKALYRAYNKAAEYLNRAPREEYVKLAIEKGGFPPKVESALTLPKYRDAVLPQADDLTACLAWLKEKNLIKADYTFEEMTADILSDAKK